VCLDRLRTDEERRGWFLIRHALRDQQRQLKLLRSQIAYAVPIALLNVLPGRRELRGRSGCPGTRAEQIERVEGRA